jgi:hypothetical protein
VGVWHAFEPLTIVWHYKRHVSGILNEVCVAQVYTACVALILSFCGVRVAFYVWYFCGVCVVLWYVWCFLGVCGTLRSLCGVL